jgi:glutaminase
VVAHSELGSDKIHKYVGQEPSGRMFNELVLDHNREYLLLAHHALQTITT